MNTIKRRLMGLNLAVLVLLSVVISAAAMPQNGVSGVPLSSYTLPSPVEAIYLSGNTVASVSDEPFRIVVGNASFNSASDKAGNGWYYHADRKCLDLTDYQGGGIRASGDLTVYIRGTVSITGTSGTYAGSGITVAGSLTLFVGGSLTVTGGSGNSRAGDAIFASEAISLYVSDGAAALFGGDASASGGYGGHALSGKQVYLSGRQVAAVGGDGYDNTAGCGIYADTVTVDADGAIQGGRGSVHAPGIYFTSTCNLGVIDATITGGGSSTSPIQTGSSNGKLYYNIHTILTRSATNQFTVRVRLYTLLLHGNHGFTADGATFTSLMDYYPTCYDLQEYLFQREGYVQMGWTEYTKNGNWVALNALYHPVTDTDLYAYWVSADAGDILLNGLSGTFADSSHYQKYSNTPVTLPDELSYPDTSLLAWGNTLATAVDEQYVFPGVWYAGNDTAQPNPDSATVLYAKTANGTYAIYHPTLGTVKAGGTILLQGTSATSSDLITYTPDASVLTAPGGYEFVGWATSEAGEVTYSPGASITIPSREVVHLYAVWERKAIEYIPEPGVRIVYTPKENLVQVVLSEAWCTDKDVAQGLLALYDDTGSGLRMSYCITRQYQAGQDLILEIDYDGNEATRLSLFTVDTSYSPATGCISFDWTDLS